MTNVRIVRDRRTAGSFYVAVVQAVHLFGSETWVMTPPVGENSRGVSPPGCASNGRHRLQTPTIRDMGVPTHWGGTGNGGTGGDQGINRPPPEHGCAIHCDLFYNGLVTGGGAKSGNAPIPAIVGESRPGYPRDKGGVCSNGGGGGVSYPDQRIAAR